MSNTTIKEFVKGCLNQGMTASVIIRKVRDKYTISETRAEVEVMEAMMPGVESVVVSTWDEVNDE